MAVASTSTQANRSGLRLFLPVRADSRVLTGFVRVPADFTCHIPLSLRAISSLASLSVTGPKSAKTTTAAAPVNQGVTRGRFERWIAALITQRKLCCAAATGDVGTL